MGSGVFPVEDFTVPTYRLPPTYLPYSTREGAVGTVGQHWNGEESESGLGLGGYAGAKGLMAQR